MATESEERPSGELAEEWLELRDPAFINEASKRGVFAHINDADVEDWTRASSMRVFQGKLFCTTATCYRALIENPRPDDVLRLRDGLDAAHRGGAVHTRRVDPPSLGLYDSG